MLRIYMLSQSRSTKMMRLRTQRTQLSKRKTQNQQRMMIRLNNHQLMNKLRKALKIGMRAKLIRNKNQRILLMIKIGTLLMVTVEDLKPTGPEHPLMSLDMKLEMAALKTLMLIWCGLLMEKLLTNISIMVKRLKIQNLNLKTNLYQKMNLNLRLCLNLNTNIKRIVSSKTKKIQLQLRKLQNSLIESSRM